MIISDSQYLSWQNRLKANKLFRIFWSFCGLYSVLVFIILGAILFLLPNSRIAALVALAAFLLARFAICEIIHLFYKKPHPYQRLNFMPPSTWLMSLTDKKLDAFPSEHLTSMAAISWVIFFYFPVLGAVLFFVAIITSAARIILGYHEISDILGGWILGILVGFIVVQWAVPRIFTIF